MKILTRVGSTVQNLSDVFIISTNSTLVSGVKICECQVVSDHYHIRSRLRYVRSNPEPITIASADLSVLTWHPSSNFWSRHLFSSPAIQADEFIDQID